MRKWQDEIGVALRGRCWRIDAYWNAFVCCMDEIMRRPVVGPKRKFRRILRHNRRRVKAVANGTVKTVIEDKGFGFITPDEGGKDVFFHVTALEGLVLSDLQAGQKVRYDADVGDRGPKATKVVRA